MKPEGKNRYRNTPSQEYNRVEALAVAEEAASPLWTSDGNMPSIQRTQGMWKAPPPAEDELDQQPILWECRALHHLISIGPGDSITDLRHKFLDGRTGHPEGILQSGVAVTSGEMLKGLDSWDLSSRSCPSGTQQ